MAAMAADATACHHNYPDSPWIKCWKRWGKHGDFRDLHMIKIEANNIYKWGGSNLIPTSKAQCFARHSLDFKTPRVVVVSTLLLVSSYRDSRKCYPEKSWGEESTPMARYLGVVNNNLPGASILMFRNLLKSGARGWGPALPSLSSGACSWRKGGEGWGGGRRR